MKPALFASFVALLAGCVTPNTASPAPMHEAAGAALAIATLAAPLGAARLHVKADAFNAGGDIPFENTQYRGNVFPGLSWSAGPADTASYVLIMQDPDLAIRGQPVLHWVLYNIPAAITKLPAGMTAPPAGASYGPNYRGAAQAYLGPRTPPGPKHRYHFQIFALDTTIAADPAITYDTLIAAMKPHVLASGEIVGLGQADPAASPPKPAD